MLKLVKEKAVFLSLGLIFLFTGCIPVLIGVGAAGGYAVSNDAAIGKVSVEYKVLWDLCVDILEEKGANFLAKDQSRGYIKALVSEHAVSIRIYSLSSEDQKLKVAARRYYLPKPLFAQDIYVEIVKELE
ncbi:MAG: hypothetical protein K9L61_03365 [Candidatus Omnitrophica bacterium]|nr:hypothetical protein [Candidatus Omnitrophota bacterium]